MKKLYFKILRDFAAVKMLAALVASSERHQYISSKIENGELNNHTATKKNVTKAILMADQLIDGIKERNSMGER
jgi:hypothetical protein